MKGAADVWRTCALVTLVLWAATGCGREKPIAEGMNVLLVTLDTTRVDYVSPFGGDPRITPHLQALADRSSLFTYALSETNVTSPSHLTIMSGLRMIEHGVLSNEARVPDGVDTLAEAMKRAGYRTAGVPAARHVGSQMGWRGFDLLDHVEDVLTATEVSDRALEWLAEPSDAPFFAWVHYFDAHSFYTPPPDIASRFYPGDREAGDGPRLADHEAVRRKKQATGLARWLGDTRDPEYPAAMYAAEIHYVDLELGRLLAGLERLGLAEQTLIVVVADHGESLGEHDIFYGHQGIYEQQLRIPLMIHVPGLSASSSNAWVTTLDLAPSISQLTGVSLRQVGAGASLVPLLLGKESPLHDGRQSFVHHQARNRAVALRENDWKLIWPIFKRDRLLSKRPELFHLGKDPDELVDLAAAEPERVRAMARVLRPLIELGEFEMGETPDLDSEALEHLRALGYLAD